jgi:hypothetical protein
MKFQTVSMYIKIEIQDLTFVICQAITFINVNRSPLCIHFDEEVPKLTVLTAENNTVIIYYPTKDSENLCDMHQGSRRVSSAKANNSSPHLGTHTLAVSEIHNSP